MNTIQRLFHTLKFLIEFVYYCIEGFVLKFFHIRKKVTGEIVLVTGSASGIGRGIALQFARLGAILVLWDIDEEGNKETAKLVKRNGALAVYVYKCDVSKREEIYTVADKVKKEVGVVNILINNAGIAKTRDFIAIPDSEMEKTMNVNAEAHFWTCKAFLPAMMACNKGHLVTIASFAALTGGKRLTDYCASKFAAFGFMESITCELWAAKQKNIKTTIVFPSFVDTKITSTPFEKLDPEYVAKKIVDAVLKDQLYVFIPRTLPLITLKIFLPRKAVMLLEEYLGFA
uniref:Epidermal retinol dehydrogenase 2 n=1 Tax=Salvator merianae TaxID=96440 RepID=A0A8D0KGU8_SALMN